MFDFFVSLLGGAYYGTKIVSDKTGAKAYDRAARARSAWHEDRLCCWEAQVVDSTLEEDLRNTILLSLSSDEQRKKVWDEVHSAYMQMPSRREEIYALSPDLMNISNFHIFGYSGPISYGQLSTKQKQEAESNWLNETLDIMLAKRGKIRGSHISHYISSVVVGFGPGKGEYSKGEWDKKYDFWLYIQGELKRHGTDSRLIFRTGYAGTNNPGIAYDIEDVDMFRYQYGELAWLPLTFFDDNLKYICL